MSIPLKMILDPVSGKVVPVTDLTATNSRITALEDTYVRSTRFAAVTTTTGTITPATGGTILLDDFGGVLDCDIQGITAGRPNGLAAFDTDGEVIAATLNTDGDFVLSGAPVDVSVAIVYRLRQKFSDYDDTNSDIVGEAQNEVGFIRVLTLAAMKATQGFEPLVAYCEEKAAVYKYCTTCGYPADDDLVLITGDGGVTRWEMVQKMSRTQGDTGWINTDAAVISALSTTQVRLAISSVAAIAICGTRIAIPIGNYDLTITGVSSPKFIYFDDDTVTLKSRDDLWDFSTQVPVMVVYWSGTAIVAAPQTEFHGIRDTVWHYWAHNFFGPQFVSGLAITDNRQPDNNTNPGSSENVYNVSLTSGHLKDEDVSYFPGSGQWSQTFGTGLLTTNAAIFNFFYFNGSFVTTMNAMADRAPFIHAGANTTPQWNNGGTLTAAINNDYIVYHFFATPMTNGWSVFGRPHNAKFTSLASALGARPTQLTWSNYAEIKHVYTLIFRVDTNWTANPHRCKLVSVSDYRATPGSPVAAVSSTSHAALSSLELAGTGVTYGHISDTTQTIVGDKTFSGVVTAPVFFESPTVISTSTTLSASVGELVLVNSSANSVNVTLPASSSVPIGTRYSIKVTQYNFAINIFRNSADIFEGYGTTTNGLELGYRGSVTVVNGRTGYWFIEDAEWTNPRFVTASATMYNGDDYVVIIPDSATITFTLNGSGSNGKRVHILRDPLAGTVQTVRIIEGSSNLIGGQSEVRLSPGQSIELLSRGSSFDVLSTTGGTLISQCVEKTTPVDADMIGLMDSAASNILKKLTWANLKATLLATAMTWTGKQTFSGFTVLGSDGPSIKMKKLTGTTASTEGANVGISHGLTGSKIISITAVVVAANGNAVTNEYAGAAGFQFHLLYNSAAVYITNHATNSENIVSRPVTITIIYEE